jgi:hypothetical protein
MPFVRIDTVAGQRAAISDVLGRGGWDWSAEDVRFQVFAEHEPKEFVFAPAYLGIRLTEGFAAIQITLVEGRSRGAEGRPVGDHSGSSS